MPENANVKLIEGIVYFEKVLKEIPGDRTALEFLSVAYEQLGDAERTRTTLIRLAMTLLREGDLAAADAIGTRLDAYSELDAKGMVLRIKAAHGLAEAQSAPTPQAAPIRLTRKTENSAETMPTPQSNLAAIILPAVKAEASLVQTLSMHGVIDAAATELLQQHLGGLPEATRPFLVSTLAVLANDNPVVAEKAAAYMADAANTPPIPLDAFDPAADLLHLLPENLMRVRGVVPFGRLGSTLLVAVLNPLDAALLRTIEETANTTCRFFLADPRKMEAILDKTFGNAENQSST